MKASTTSPPNAAPPLSKSFFIGGGIVTLALFGWKCTKYLRRERNADVSDTTTTTNVMTTASQVKHTIFRTWNTQKDSSDNVVQPQKSIVVIKSLDSPDDCVIIENYDTNRTGGISSERDHIKVRVPAVTSGFGAGMDCIGMALDLWLEIEVRKSDEFSFEFEGIDCDCVRRDRNSLICSSVERMFKRVNRDVPPLRYYCRSTIPCNKGLGLSAASIVGGIIAGAVLSGVNPLPNYHQLLQIAADNKCERGIDSIAAALYGGVQIAINSGTQPLSRRIGNGSNDVCAIVFVPDESRALEDARSKLPHEVSLADCKFNIGRTAFLVYSLCHRDAPAARSGTEDVIHQKALEKMYPHLSPLISAATDAGAHCCFLSGGGPSVVALIFTERDDARNLQNSLDPVQINVANKMLECAETCSTKGKVLITRVVDRGAAICKEYQSKSDSV